MLAAESPLTALRRALASGTATPLTVAEVALARANAGASHNTYLWQDWEWLLQEAHALVERGAYADRPPLWSIPVSVKDCFDLAGTVTTCGARFYAEQPAAARDSSLVSRLRALGALITGKTHLHPLAYGITGQNPEYGDCLQPRDSSVLTGGSSSGAAASVQEGSALAAIGTDTGGSVRVPAALCGLVGYRASHSQGVAVGLWQGGAHLAPSFDTIGLLVRDPRDVGPIARAVFSVPEAVAEAPLRIGCVGGELLAGCEPDVQQAFGAWRQQMALAGATLEECAPTFWDDSMEIFAGIQAHEAAGLHAGRFDRFEPTIRDRLRWGASLDAGTLAALRSRLAVFQSRMAALFTRYDLLMLPAAPVSRLAAESDLSDARSRILAYTTPFSLAGLPALSLPGELIGAPFGTGVQVAAEAGSDALLLAFADRVGASLAGPVTAPADLA